MKKLIYLLIVIGVVGGGLFIYQNQSNGNEESQKPTVAATRGDLVDQALAIGTIEPENEISIKSKVSGVVENIFVDVGSYVTAGTPMIEVRPDPTPLELADAKRQVELRQADLENLKKQRVRQQTLRDKNLISEKAYDDFELEYQEAELQLNIALERLALIESGKVTIGDTKIETVIKAPIDGYLLSKYVEVGDPVTPLTSYQEGTVLMRIANMENLIFRGTVDEIDVGRLVVGMPTELTIGALPDKHVTGTLQQISLKAEKRDNATVFPIEILVEESTDTILRAGYSANANIIIEKKEDVLLIPERTVYFENDTTFVMVETPTGQEEKRLIETGLSDAIQIEIIAGLEEGEKVVEKPVREIQ